MGKVNKLAIISLSRGIIGEPFVSHEVNIGKLRLSGFGLEYVFTPSALKGLDFIKNHPEERANDLIMAMTNDSIDMVLCAIGGDDTYSIAPYLFKDEKIQEKLKNKIFLGYSDSTFNHFMLRRLGLKTFYGQSFLSDVCEISETMLPYSEYYFKELITTGRIANIKPAPLVYKGREDFSISAVGTSCPSTQNDGFKLLQGFSTFSGKIFGGCLDTIYDMFDNTRYEDTVEITKKYNLFPSANEPKDHILLLETSEEMMSPEKFEKALNFLKAAGVFSSINGILFGRPYDNVNSDEYNEILKRVINDPTLPIVTNINIGHSTPRCIIPFEVYATVNVPEQIITFDYDKQ